MMEIKSDIQNFSYGEHVSFQVRTRAEKYGYELVNIASSHAEAEKIAEAHKIQLEQMFTVKPADTEEDETVKKPKRKNKKSSEFTVVNNDSVNDEIDDNDIDDDNIDSNYVKDINFNEL